MNPRLRHAAGYTFFEAIIVVALFAILVLAFGQVFGSTNTLSAESHAKLRAQEDNRRSLESIGNRLRNACWSSLRGFASDGTSTAPTYQCAMGATASGPILDVAKVLSWRATPGRVDGVVAPGELICTEGGVSTVIAPRVPKDGFKVIQSGTALRVQLSTYYSSSDRKTTTASAEVQVFPRN